MPIVRPFRGILYDPAVVGPLERVVAPPYDVIGREEQDRLYEASPFNVIRLDLSRDSDRYGSACRLYHEWLRDGVLARDPEPGIYPYAQRYRVDGGPEKERWGFFTRLRLEDFSTGKVLPHEKTLDAAKADRLELQRACRANLSSIFAVYSIPGFRLEDELDGAIADEPRIEIRDATGVHHRFWRVFDPAIQDVLVRRLRDRTVYIADGHHRYETALRYRDEMRELTGRRGGDEPFDYVLAFLSNMEEPGLTVLPTHRVVRELAIPAEALIRKLRDLFAVEEVALSEGVEALRRRLVPAARDERRIGLVVRGHDRALVLVARDGAYDERLRGSTALRRLDVTLLHGLVLEGEGSVLGLDAHEEVETGRLAYVKDDREAIRLVTGGEFAAAFLLGATRLGEIRAVCEAGETMPEKSTYFFPKLLTGLVFNSVED